MVKYREKFGIVTQKVVTDPELSLQAKGIYSILCTYANKNRSCFPSIATIADIANVSCSTVDRKIKELKKAGYLTRNGRLININ